MFNKSTKKQPVNEETTVFVTAGDTMMGFYAARSMLVSRKFEEVVVGVTDTDNEFVRTLENEGAIIKEWDLNSTSSIRQCLRDVEALVLVPHPDWKVVETTKKILEVAKEEEELERLVLWSCIHPKSSNDDDNDDDDDDNNDDDDEGDDDSSSKRGSMRRRSPKSRKNHRRGGKDHKNIERLTHEIEQLVRKNYVHDWTICRVGFPIQSMFVLSEIIQNRGVIPLAIGEGEFAPVNLKDCGHAIVKLLECESVKGGKSEHSRQVYTFTGPNLVDGEKLAEKANRALGTSSLSFADVSTEEMREILEKQGGEELNEFIIEAMLLHMHQIKKEELEIRTNDLEKLLKHAPLTVEKFFQENNDMFRPRGGRMVIGPIRDY